MIVCDIDGTIANNRHRAHLVECEKPDWKAFYNPDLVMKDTPFENAERILLEMLNRDPGRLIFLTAREFGVYDVTMEWINKNYPALKDRFELYTRDVNDDYKPAVEFKEKKLTLIRYSELEHEAAPIHCFEDDARLWEMFRSKFNAYVHKAPQCWNVLFPVP